MQELNEQNQTFLDKLELLKAERGINDKQAAALIDLTPTYLSQIRGGKRNAGPKAWRNVRFFLDHPNIVSLSASEVGIPEAPMVLTSATGEILWVNEALTELCGYTIDELRGKRPGKILQGIHSDFTEIEKIRSAMENTKSVTVKIINYHKDGNPYFVEIRIEPVFGLDGTVCNFIATEKKLPMSAINSGLEHAPESDRVASLGLTQAVAASLPRRSVGVPSGETSQPQEHGRKPKDDPR